MTHSFPPRLASELASLGRPERTLRNPRIVANYIVAPTVASHKIGASAATATVVAMVKLLAFFALIQNPRPPAWLFCSVRVTTSGSARSPCAHRLLVLPLRMVAVPSLTDFWLAPREWFSPTIVPRGFAYQTSAPHPN